MTTPITSKTPTTNTDKCRPSQLVFRETSIVRNTLKTPNPWESSAIKPKKTKIWNKGDEHAIAWVNTRLIGQELVLWKRKIQSWTKDEIIDWETNASTYTPESLEAFFNNGLKA